MNASSLSRNFTSVNNKYCEARNEVERLDIKIQDDRLRIEKAVKAGRLSDYLILKKRVAMMLKKLDDESDLADHYEQRMSVIEGKLEVIRQEEMKMIDAMWGQSPEVGLSSYSSWSTAQY